MDSKLKKLLLESIKSNGSTCIGDRINIGNQCLNCPIYKKVKDYIVIHFSEGCGNVISNEQMKKLVIEIFIDHYGKEELMEELL